MKRKEFPFQYKAAKIELRDGNGTLISGGELSARLHRRLMLFAKANSKSPVEMMVHALNNLVEVDPRVGSFTVPEICTKEDEEEWDLYVHAMQRCRN